MNKNPFNVFAALIFFFSPVHGMASDQLQKINGQLEQGRFVDAEKALQKQLAKKNSPQEAEKFRFLQATAVFHQGQYDKSIQLIDEALKTDKLLEEELRSLKSKNFEAQKKWAEVLAEDKKVLELSPNFHIRSDSYLRRGRAYRSLGKLREAQSTFSALERRARGTTEYPEVLIELARTQMQQKNTRSACRWLVRIYKKYPNHSIAKEWGPDLSVNLFDGNQTNCSNTKGEFRERLRALLFAGEEEKARKEVQLISGAVAEGDRAEGDLLRAWFLLQAGFPDEAYALLEPYASKEKNNADFLGIFASAAARTGHSSVAVGAYHRIWEMSPTREKGRKALYQSAFLSYQFRDYDGASRRFNQFIKKYPRSGLSRDAKWNLAWITYLKGDFSAARNRFEEIQKSRYASKLRDKAQYWIAMTHLRQDRPDLAKNYLETVSHDKSGSYYSLLAKQRLSKLPPTVAPKIEVEHLGPRTWGPISATSVLLPSADGWDAYSTVSQSEESESEESLAMEAESLGDEIADDSSDEEAGSDLVQETGRSEIAEEVTPLFQSGSARRVERARALIAMNLINEARWEIYEIEKKKNSHEELKVLISLYEEAGQWHRSSSIATLKFGIQRLNQGMNGARDLWISAYPRAYESDVVASSKKYSLPPEFIWGLMKAESRYRRDAVSPVGALGLMQIMPNTGRKIASLTGDRGFSPSELLQPETAVSMGAYYLRRLANQFGDSLPLTAAGYNAGPHRVHAWLTSFGGLDYDEFVEHIPFLETREYVRRVISNALTYSDLYNGTKNMVDLVGPVKAKGRPELAKKENWDPL